MQMEVERMKNWPIYAAGLQLHFEVITWCIRIYAN